MTPADTSSGKPPRKEQIRFYYESEHPRAHRFRYALLAFDIATVLFIVGSSFIERSPALKVIDVVLGLLILADFSARLFISGSRLRDLRHPATWAMRSPSSPSWRR